MIRIAKLHTSIISVGICLTGIFGSHSAKATSIYEQVPTAHSRLETHDLSNQFVADAYESARLNSPFAGFVAEPTKIPFKNATLAQKMVEYASEFLGTRYRRGASGPKAFDCSGFTSYVFKKFGFDLNRSSRMQYQQGKKISVDDLEPGDLLFFSSSSSGRGNVGHVAMVSEVDKERGVCRFIHASVKHGVTYQSFPDGGYYDRHFIGAKRLLD